MPFVCPPTAHSNVDCSCSIKNGSSDPAEKGKQHQEVPLSPDAAESQRAVSGNRLVPREESPPGRSWSSGDAGQGLPGGRRQKKRPEKFGQKSVACQEAHQCPDRSLKMDTLGAKKAEGNIKALGCSEGIARHQQVGHSLGGSKDGEEDVTERRCPPSPNPEAVWKRQRSDLLPNLAVFRELDAHVLRVSRQLKPKRGLWSVQTVVSLITGGASSQLEKARAIWVWLCQNIEYDVCGFLGLSEKIHLPQEVLQTGRGVCSGYAHLFCEMCKEVGLTCAEISGYGRGVGESYGQCCPQKKSNHVWNALKLDARWFLLDVCWGAGQVDLAQKQFIRRQEDFFFLTKPEEFIQSHWPEDPRWQLIHPPIPREVFEERAFKTPEFFKLRLALLSPDTSVLRTDEGEVTVSLASTHSTEFTYKLLKFCLDGHQEDVGKAHGLLTHSENRMILRIFPPSEGLFGLQVFARPSESQEPYAWVCSHQIECLQFNGEEQFPENPFSFWGVHPKAKEFGIEGCNWGDNMIVARTGVQKLILKIQRPLLAAYKLVHPSLDDTVSKQCLLSQTEEEKLSCHILCPYAGHYRLSVFVKGLIEDEFHNVANLLVRCSHPVNLNKLFPLGLSPHCGMGISAQWRGLSNPTHRAPIISTKKGRCTLAFCTQLGFEAMAVLDKDKATCKKYAMERYVLITHLERKMSISVRLPEAGSYRVTLYGRSAESQEFTHVCDYVIRCFATPRWPPFPRVYSLWRRGCVLLRPRSGVLQAKRWVKFRMKVPKAYSVHVIGDARVDLKLAHSHVWEGEVYTGLAGATLKVAVKLSPLSPCMEVILSFDIEFSSLTVGDSSG